jgi:hypothetical protein
MKSHRRYLFLLLLTFFVLCANGQTYINGQTFTDGLVVIDAPSPGSPGHAGSPISIALEMTGNGKISLDDANPNSTDSTHYSLLEIYLVSSDTVTNLNLTVSYGTGLLTQEPGSTVKHLNWNVPTCVPAGNYSLTFYETAAIQGQPTFTITNISIPIQNPNPSSTPCSSTANVTTNTLQPQPQADNALPSPIFAPGGSSSFSNGPTSSGPAFITITLSGPLPFPIPSTVTVTPSATPTTVYVVSMTTETVTTSGPSGFITTTITEAAYTSAVAVTQNADNSGFLPVNAGPRIEMEISLVFISLTVGLWMTLFRTLF